MVAPTTATRPPTDERAFPLGDDGRDDYDPPSGETDVVRSSRRLPSGRTIILALVAVVVIGLIIFAAVTVTNWQADKRFRQERINNAFRDLNNRAQDKAVGGNFTRVYYADQEMRATFVRSDGLKRCNMLVVAPTDKVLRYSASGVPATDASFRMLKDPDAIGCLEASGGGAVGGG